MTYKLTRRTKVIYGAGDIGFSLTSTILGAYFAIFLTDVVGIAPGIAAIALFIGRSWDYVNDPLIGYISDRTRSRWGRRRRRPTAGPSVPSSRPPAGACCWPPFRPGPTESRARSTTT